MNHEDKLRNTLRGYYDNQEAPFGDEDWERASTYLNATRRKRKVVYGAIALVVLLSTLIAALLYGTPAVTEKTAVASLPKQAALNGTLEKPIVREQAVPVRNNNKANFALGATKTQSGIAFSPANKAILKIKEKTPSDPVAQSDEDKPVAQPVKTIPKTKKSIASPAIIQQQDSTTLIAPGNSDRSLVPPTESTGPKESSKSAAAKTGMPVPVDPILNDAGPGTTTQTKIPANADHTLSANYADTSAARTPGAVKSMTLNTGEETLQQSIPVSAEAVTENNTVTDTVYSITPLAYEGIFYEAGVAWLYGWKGPSHRDARGVSPILGIHYMNRISRHYAFSFGLQYLQVSNLSNSSKTSRVSSYAYGEQSRVTVITPSSAYYLLAPLRMHYYANERNSFSAGLSFACLLNVNARVSSYDEKPGYTGNSKTVTMSGYTEGFSWFDSQASIGYRRKFKDCFAVQAEVFIGLTDVKQDAFFGFSKKERNSGAKLSLIYYSSRKNKR